MVDGVVDLTVVHLVNDRTSLRATTSTQPGLVCDRKPAGAQFRF